METSHHIDLTIPEHAYFLGFVQGDGHLARNKAQPNKGKLTIELSIRDQDLLHHFKAMFPESSISYRHRVTNFSDDYDSVVWRMCRQGFREQMERLGVPVGNKSLLVEPPQGTFSVVDYWRGIIDADGSLGVTGKGLPFISLVTTSAAMAKAYANFLYTLTGKIKVFTRNQRDGAYNIALFREDAVTVVRALYPQECLGLERKKAKARQVTAWVRPTDMRIVASMKPWSQEEDRIVLSYSVEKAAQKLARTLSSVANRRQRLRKARFVVKDGDQSAEGSA